MFGTWEFKWARPSLLLVIVCSLMVRLAAVLPLHADGQYLSDERQYVAMAHRILDGSGFISENGELSTIAPLYIFLLAGIFKISGGSIALAHVVGCLLGVCIVVLGYMLALEIFDNERVALLAAGAIALHPSLIIYSGLLVTETLYMVFFLGSFLLAYRMRGRMSIGGSVLFGFVSALAALTRAVFFGFFPLLLFSIWWIRKKDASRGAMKLVLALVVWCVVLAPWSVRNFHVHHTFVPVSTGGGKVLLLGNNPFASKVGHMEGFDGWLEQQAEAHGVQNVSSLSEIDRFSLYREIAIGFIISHPLETAILAMEKAYIFWIFPVANTASDIALQAFVVACDCLWYVAAAVGLAAFWQHRARLVLPVIAVVFFTGVQMVFHAEARFRLPLMPFLCMMCGYAAMVFTDARQRAEFMMDRRKTRGSAIAIAGIVCIYVSTGVLFLTGKV